MTDNENLQKKQFRMTAALTAVGVLVLAALLTLVIIIAPAAKSVRETSEAAREAIDSLTAVTDSLTSVDLGSVAKDLESVADELSSIEWETLAKDIDKTATDAQKGLQSALDAIDSLDIDSLNQAIEDLGTVVRPLANLLGKFK